MDISPVSYSVAELGVTTAFRKFCSYLSSDQDLTIFRVIDKFGDKLLVFVEDVAAPVFIIYASGKFFLKKIGARTSYDRFSESLTS